MAAVVSEVSNELISERERAKALKKDVKERKSFTGTCQHMKLVRESNAYSCGSIFIA
jgi:hypothetical protein